MASKDENNMDVDELTKLMDNIEVDPNNPTSQMNRLTSLLASRSLDREQPRPIQLAKQPANSSQTDEDVFNALSSLGLDESNLNNVEYPPGTTSLEQLLILAGVNDYDLGGIPIEGYPHFSDNNASPDPYPPVELPATPPAFGSLPPTPPLTSQPTAGEISYWASVRSTAKQKYGWMTAYKLEELASATLPEDQHELAELCTWMSDEMEDRWLKFGILPVLAPEGHMWYPYWAPGRSINGLIDQAMIEINRRKGDRKAKVEGEDCSYSDEREYGAMGAGCQ